MGDNRLDVKISVVGSDGKEHKIDWWVNWYENYPRKVHDAMIEMAMKAGLTVDGFYDGEYNHVETDYKKKYDAVKNLCDDAIDMYGQTKGAEISANSLNPKDERAELDKELEELRLRLNK